MDRFVYNLDVSYPSSSKSSPVLSLSCTLAQLNSLYALEKVGGVRKDVGPGDLGKQTNASKVQHLYLSVCTY